MATVNVWAQRAAKARQGPQPPQPPPPPAPTKVVHRPVVTDPWPTVTSANGQPPKKPTPPASPSAVSSTLATPAFSSPANSGAVSPAEPAKASGSGSTSSSARSPAPSTSNIPPNSSAKTKPRKWVPIPPEELRAAAQQQQRTNPTNHRNGRKSQSHSGTTSRAESVVSLDRDRDQQRDYPQPAEQQTDYTSSNGWTYEPPREPYYPQPYPVLVGQSTDTVRHSR
ncbi:hypothetical protein C8F01DRAFT_322442 [Mycena amicta]|nr:hypothetical protein C8F01DRAFT_322442 [Mycena amicta]